MKTTSARNASLLIVAAITSMLLPLPRAAWTSEADHPSNFSKKPASRWQDAMVSGNGTLGVMVFGDPANERYIFNHEMLYEYIGTESIRPASTAKVMPQVKQLIADGKFGEAHRVTLDEAIKNGHPGILFTDPYHPAAALTLAQQFDGEVSKYQRSTNYETGEVTVAWSANDHQFERRTVVSRPGQVIATKLSASGEKLLNVRLTLDHQMPDSAAQLREKNPEITGNIEMLHADRLPTLNTPLLNPPDRSVRIIDDSRGALTFRVNYQIVDRGYEVDVLVVQRKGQMIKDGEQLLIENADEIEIRSRIKRVEPYVQAQAGLNSKAPQALKPYSEILESHANVHGERFSRVRLQLDKTGFNSGSNSELIETQRVAEKINPYLLERVFEMGIYGLISSSGDNPPNLMGIWNGEWRPKWSGDFTTDANVNLQIAAANLANQPEAIDSYMRMLERVAPDWEVNAKELYGCRGYLSGPRTSGRRNFLTHFGNWPGNHWTAGAAWLLSPCYEYYECSGDVDFLRERLLPMMVKTSLFYEDFLDTYDKDGKLFIAPSYSPENQASNQRGSRGVSANAAMDIAVIHELMTNLITACEEQGLHTDKIPTWQRIRSELPPQRINRDGALAEWADSRLDDRYNHRHVSHLYLAWPSRQLTPENEKLFEAAKVAMEKRGRGNGSAHGLAHSALIGARLKQPELVYGNLLFLLKEDYLYDSLFTSHNPGIIHNSDALHSIPAVILEMLVYSRPGVIELLPACSREFNRGSVYGVKCRTMATVEKLAWNFDKNELTCQIKSLKDQVISIAGPGPIDSATVDGKPINLSGDEIDLKFQADTSRKIELRW
ncbi:MAG: glycoside hydrolase N-terminal domain-containing protein [Planctomycetota bacterium]